MPIYLDYNATTPLLPEVADIVCRTMLEEFGNAGSRTHEFGLNAKRIVEAARQQVAEIVNADKAEVIFTSGATESNNIAILGLREFGKKVGKRHIITTKVEHKSVLEPFEYLKSLGFEVTYLDVSESGCVDVNDLRASLREDTLLVSVMHINNETGVIQPITDICKTLANHEAYFHVDAAQSFGKFPFDLMNKRIDLISASGHKLYAPKGIGALVLRRRGYLRPPLEPIMFGGGQEKGLRPGTLAVPLIAGFGAACDIASKRAQEWFLSASETKKNVLRALMELNAVQNGENTSPYVLNFSVPGINSEAAMVSLKKIVAVSNGSACTSNSYKLSHVLSAMKLNDDRIAGAIRFSFGPEMKELPIKQMIKCFRSML
ncbi:MAG: cysteine desulfurase DndA [Methyloprofundus sp.]|nr:cysteine desulfurase DndA [Methyloprofundus sp.]